MTAGVKGDAERARGAHAASRSGHRAGRGRRSGVGDPRAGDGRGNGIGLGAGVAAPRTASAGRGVIADVAAALVLVTVLPLALLQLPDAMAWAVPARFAAAGPAAETSLLRASGLAIFAMAIATPLGGLAVRVYRAWPVLVTGLVIAAGADILGGARATVITVGADRGLHGAGAGLAIAAATTLAAERCTASSRRRSHSALAGWWAGCAVVGLAAAPEVMRHRLAAGDWHAALRPYPWLTGAALCAVALYALVEQTPVPPGARGDFTSAERTQLAVLTAPVAGMCAVTVAVTFGPGTAVTAAAIACGASLGGLVVVTSRTGSAGWFAVVCAVTGFTLAPAAGALGDVLRPPDSALHIVPGLAMNGLALLASLASVAALAAVCGAALALALPARFSGLVVAAGCVTAGTGYLIGGFPARAGVLAGDHDRLLAVVCALVAGGLTAALAAAWRRLTAPGRAGAATGVTLMLAAVLAGYLADSALELHALGTGGAVSTAGTSGTGGSGGHAAAGHAAAAHAAAALRDAAAQWYLIAAMIVGCVALSAGIALFTSGFPRLNRVGEVHEAAGAPVAEAGRAAKSE